jgi:hypothetical protein
MRLRRSLDRSLGGSGCNLATSPVHLGGAGWCWVPGVSVVVLWIGCASVRAVRVSGLGGWAGDRRVSGWV